MKRIVISGLGDVLLGDGGVGPYVIHLLEHHYHFEGGVSVRDSDRQASDVGGQISDAGAVILIDAVCNGAPPGTVTLYRRQDILPQRAGSVLIDPSLHSLSDLLALVDSSSERPREFLLIAITGQRFEPGFPLTPEVRCAAKLAMNEILRELDRLDVGYAPRAGAAVSSASWETLTDPVAF